MARNFRGGRVINRKQWKGIAGISLTASTEGAKGGAFISFSEPATVLRVCSRWMSWLDATKQAADAMSVSVGVLITSTDAATLGAMALPDPFGELNYPWLWLGHMDLASELAAASEAFGISQQVLEIDTKAMRRVSPGESLSVIVEYAGAAGAPVTWTEITPTRVLLGLH